MTREGHVGARVTFSQLVERAAALDLERFVTLHPRAMLLALDSVSAVEGSPEHTAATALQREGADGEDETMPDLRERFAALASGLSKPEGELDPEVLFLEGPRMTVGRSSDNDIAFGDSTVSRHHARLDEVGGEWTIHDLGARNGVLLNGTPFAGSARLKDRDVIRLGQATALLFHRAAGFHATVHGRATE